MWQTEILLLCKSDLYSSFNSPGALTLHCSFIHFHSLDQCLLTPKGSGIALSIRDTAAYLTHGLSLTEVTQLLQQEVFCV